MEDQRTSVPDASAWLDALEQAPPGYDREAPAPPDTAVALARAAVLAFGPPGYETPDARLAPATPARHDRREPVSMATRPGVIAFNITLKYQRGESLTCSNYGVLVGN